MNISLVEVRKFAVAVVGVIVEVVNAGLLSGNAAKIAAVVIAAATAAGVYITPNSAKTVPVVTSVPAPVDPAKPAV